MVRRSLSLGLLSALVSVLLYVFVVILTSPNVPASYAVRATLFTNYPFILALGLGFGLFFYTNEELKMRGCRIKSAKSTGLSTGGSGLAVLLSYFSLTHFGCCGFWIYIMSILPGFIGVGASTLLLEYREAFMVLALLPTYAVVVIRAYRLLNNRPSGHLPS